MFFSSKCQKVRDCFIANHVFNFTPVTSDEIRKEFLKLHGSSVKLHGDMSVDILKKSIEIYLDLTKEVIHRSFRKGVFPEVLKFAEVSPTFKRNDNLNKEIDRSVNILSHLPKVLEKLMFR